jgi:hypothetical protein
MEAVAQYEKTMIVLKLRGARQRMRAKTGLCDGRKPYGEHDAEQSILARMRLLRGQGMAVDTIADTLNAEGLNTRSGGLWDGATMNRILKAS